MADFEHRRGKSFSQAEGLAKMPPQLKLRELSPYVRALLWDVIYQSMIKSRGLQRGYSSRYIISGMWATILYDHWVKVRHKPADEFDNLFSEWTSFLKDVILNKSYNLVFDFIQFVLQHQNYPDGLSAEIERVLVDGRAAYRLIDGDLVVPISSDEEAVALENALISASEAEFNGARKHLKEAAQFLAKGAFASSVRESVHAVESTARSLAGNANELAPALQVLEKKGYIHPAMKAGFQRLYGYSSDEKGVRHALLADDVPNVTETDAIYMLGGCASFVSYLIGKAREFDVEIV